MTISGLIRPQTDPTPIFEHYRGSYGSELLTAAISHFNVFGRLADGGKTPAELAHELELADRPAVVLLTALRAMQLLAISPDGRLMLTALAQEHLLSGGELDVGDYVAMSAESPGVLAMVERLRTNRPAAAKPQDQGAAFIFREGLQSAMDRSDSARRLTMALAGRAKNVAPFLAEQAKLENCRLLLDVGGGTGIYSIACLARFPNLRAAVWDRPEVLKVAVEIAAHYGVSDRLECVPGDMFSDPVPTGADAILLSNILHDWDVPQCQELVNRCAAALPRGGQLMVHDVFLNDALDGPLPIALYSAALFSVTEGRAYSAAEYRVWLTSAGLTPAPEVSPTLVHCGLLSAVRE